MRNVASKLLFMCSMGNSWNPEAEMERLAGFHEKIVRLRDQLKRLKQKQSDTASGNSSGADTESLDTCTTGSSTSETY
jgi:hypothetical protein